MKGFWSLWVSAQLSDWKRPHAWVHRCIESLAADSKLRNKASYVDNAVSQRTGVLADSTDRVWIARAARLVCELVLYRPVQASSRSVCKSLKHNPKP